MEQSKEMIQEIAENDELDLLDLLKYFLRKIKYVIAAALIGAVVAGLYVYFLVTPLYQATAQLYVVNSGDEVINLSDFQIGSYLKTDYQLVFNTWEVNQQVIENLNLPYSVSQLESMVSVSNPQDTRALFVTVTSPYPAEAAAIANEMATVARQYIADTMLTEMPTTLSVALEPKEPFSPNKTQTVIVGFLVGMLLSLGVLFIAFVLDDKVKSSSDIVKYTGAAPLAVVPLTNVSSNNKKSKGR